MRRLKLWRAFLASIAGLGLGYLYVGRPRAAFAVPLGVLTIVGAVAWTRLILNPFGTYLLLFALSMISIVSLIHPITLARRVREAPVSRWNRGWVYAAWVIGSLLFSSALSASRPTLFGFEPFRIPSVSMSPTMQRGDLVMVDTWRYRSALPSYGDLVVFNVPREIDLKYVFRVVGLPEDRIELRDSELYRNDRQVDEAYLGSDGAAATFVRSFGSIVLDSSSIFVLGDNRGNAMDSRFLGPIPKDLLHGRVEHRWFAFDDVVHWERFPQTLVVDDE
jgi:signal peptidase I